MVTSRWVCKSLANLSLLAQSPSSHFVPRGRHVTSEEKKACVQIYAMMLGKKIIPLRKIFFTGSLQKGQNLNLKEYYLM